LKWRCWSAFPNEELLASLLIFRFLYFILPLALAAILLGLRESSLIARSATDLKQSNAQRLGKRGRSDYNQAL
jgi:hypothetical protein